VEVLADLATGDCQDGEIGMLEIDASKIVAQAGFSNAAFTLTDVTDPTNPSIIGIWDWNTRAVSADLKTFRQGERHYLAIAMQRGRTDEGRELPCGIGIVEVTDPTAPRVVTRLDGRNTGGAEPWCSVHTLEIDTDAQGDATFFVVSDVDTFSARAVDVRDLSQPREVNFYHLHSHPHAVPDQPVLHYVHDSFISDDKVYLAHWLDGSVVLDKARFFAGDTQTPTIINPTEDVAPGGFRVHYNVPLLDGDFLFVQDELNADNGIRLLDVRDPADLKTLWVEKNAGGVNAPHNFVLRDGILYVGWYNDGVKMFRVDTSNPDAPTVTPLGFQEVRANKVITRENYFDGVWGIRVDACEVRGEAATCVYLSDIGGRLGILRMNN
jgi:hypothetical protein